jgi:tetratricopeptide (TPR) repeat protein
MVESSRLAMFVNRLEALKNIVAQNPGDAFARYGLAMEYSKAASYEQALAEFRILLASNPDYAYAYFHAGQTLEKLGRAGEAGEMYRRGIEAAGRQGDAHARDELRAALEQLG